MKIPAIFLFLRIKLCPSWNTFFPSPILKHFCKLNDGLRTSREYILRSFYSAISFIVSDAFASRKYSITSVKKLACSHHNLKYSFQTLYVYTSIDLYQILFIRTFTTTAKLFDKFYRRNVQPQISQLSFQNIQFPSNFSKQKSSPSSLLSHVAKEIIERTS